MTSEPRLRIHQIVETLEIGEELFWEPLRATRPGAWTGHLATAFWLVKAVAPRIVVELGTQSGNSYSAFCQAIAQFGLPARAYAVDTWKGDEHSGLYGEEVFTELNAFNESHFAGFSKLLRTTFDDARPYFADGSVDLLHIDGYHSYEAVRRDFDTWRSAMSPSGVVVFHDTNVRERGFGVWKLWSELAASYPSFEFSHAEGLGILGVGKSQTLLAGRLFKLGKSPEAASLVQRLFSARGETFRGRVRALDLESLVETLSQDLKCESERVTVLEQDLARALTLAYDREHELQAKDEKIHGLEGEAQRKDETIRGLEGEAQRKDEVIREKEHELLRKDEAIRALESEVQRKDEVIRRHEQELQHKDELIYKQERAVATLEREKNTGQKQFELERARLQRQLSNSKAEGEQTAKDLAETVQQMAAARTDLEKTAQQLATQTATLNQILQSRGWKALSVYYRVRQKLGSLAPRRIRRYRQMRHDYRLIVNSGLFDAQWYLEQYSDVAKAGVDPVLHYLRHGALEGRDPNPYLDSDWYLQNNGDVAASGMNPLVHYLRFGAPEGRASHSDARPQSPARGSSRQLGQSADVPEQASNGPVATSHLAPDRTLQIRPMCEHVRPAKRRSNGSRGPLLCFTHVLPYPSRAGNEYRIHRMLQSLSDFGYEVYLIICPLGGYEITDEGLEEACGIYRNLILCEREGRILHHLANGNTCIHELSGRKMRDFADELGEDGDPGIQRLLHPLRTFCPDALIEVVLHLNAVLRPQVVLAEYVFTTRVLPLLGNDVVKVVDTIDVFSTKHSKVKRFGVPDSLAISSDEERLLLERCDIVIAIQPEEEKELRGMAPGKTVVTAGIDFEPIAKTPPVPSRPVVLLVGSDNAMNVKGTKDFLRFAWPLVTRQVPEAELRIVGAVGARLEVDDPSVTLVGTVKDLADEYVNARAVVNPAVAGTGLKIKTVEAICHLRPIVTWPTGVDGIPDSMQALCRVATDWYSFARFVIEVCTSDQASREMISNRDAIREAFSPSVIYGDLRKALDVAVARRGLTHR